MKQKQDASKASEPHVKSNAQKIERKHKAFRKLARSLALAISDRGVRKALEAELEKRYTGAPEALYGMIKDRKIQDGPPLQKRLARSYASHRQQKTGEPIQTQEALRDVKDYVARIPKLHVAMPLHLAEWNAESEVPLVSYMPVDKDEKEQRSFKVEAYDASGRTRLLKVDLKNIYVASTGEPVDRPVVVLAINERTNAKGELLPAFQPTGRNNGAETQKQYKEPCSDCGGGGGGGDNCDPSYGSRESGDVEEIYAAKVTADNEYSYNEPADISFRIFAHSDEMVKNDGYTDPEPQDQWHDCTDSDGRDVVEKLLRWYWDDYGEYIVVDWYEHDNAGQFTASFDYTFPDDVTISVGYETNDDNDPMGRAVINKDDPSGDEYGARDIDFKTRWRE